MASDLTVPALMGTGISLAIFVTFVYGAHMYLACIKGRKFAWEDGWLTAAYVVFIVITALYLNASDVIFRLEGLSTGQVLPYEPEKMAADGLKVQKTFFVTTSGLWICLWLIKASLLSLYKRLMSNLRLYIILWWTVVVICVVVCSVEPPPQFFANEVNLDTRSGHHIVHVVMLYHECLVHSGSMQHSSRH